MLDFITLRQMRSVIIYNVACIQTLNLKEKRNSSFVLFEKIIAFYWKKFFAHLSDKTITDYIIKYLILAIY